MPLSRTKRSAAGRAITAALGVDGRARAEALIGLSARPCADAAARPAGARRPMRRRDDPREGRRPAEELQGAGRRLCGDDAGARRSGATTGEGGRAVRTGVAAGAGRGGDHDLRLRHRRQPRPLRRLGRATGGCGLPDLHPWRRVGGPGRGHRRLRRAINRVDGSYDDSIVLSAEMAAKNGWIVVSDTSWEGYETIPLKVMQGYTVMIGEALDALAEPPTTSSSRRASAAWRRRSRPMRAAPRRRLRRRSSWSSPSARPASSRAPGPAARSQSRTASPPSWPCSNARRRRRSAGRCFSTSPTAM